MIKQIAFALAINLALATASLAPAGAQAIDAGIMAEIDALEEGIISSLVAGDTESDPNSRTLSYRAALEAFDALAARAKTGPAGSASPTQQAAQTALERLRSSALTADTIAVHLLEAELARFAVARPASGDFLTEMVGVNELVGRVVDPVLRSGAALTVARFLISRNAKDAAGRYIQILLAGIDRAPDPEARSALGRGLLWLAGASGSDSYSLITIGAKSLATPAARAVALQETAAAILGQGPSRNAVNPVPEVEARLTRGDGRGALWLALSTPLSQGGWRDAAISLVINTMKRRENFDLAILAALGVADEKMQVERLAELADAALWSGRTRVSADAARLISDRGRRVRILVSAAERSLGSGYIASAQGLFREAQDEISAGAARGDVDLIGRVAGGLAETDATGEAMQLVEGARQSSVEGRVAAGFAAAKGRAGDLTASMQWLGRIPAGDQRDAIGVKVGFALLSSGNLDGARQIAESVANAHLGAPLVRDLALAFRAAGQAGKATPLVQRMPAGLERLALTAALTMRSDETSDGDGPYARFRRAREQLAGPELEAAIGIMAPVLAEFGRGEEARQLTGAVLNPERKAEIEGEIVVAEMQKGLSRNGLEHIRNLPDWRLRVDLFRRIAVAKSKQLDRHGIIGTALGVAGASKKTMPAGGPIALQEIERADDLSVSEGATEFPVSTIPDLPEISLRASNVRAMTPATKGGQGGLALARLSRYNVKFFEESLGTGAGVFLYKAQGSINPRFIDVNSGVVGIADLRRLLGAEADRFLPIENGVATVRLPIVVGPKATLVLSGEEVKEVRLSSTAGAFLVNVGKLYVVDTELVAFNEELGRPAYATYEQKDRFRPFITMWSDSQSYFAASRIVALGYSSGKSYGLSFSAGPKDIVTVRDNEVAPSGIMVENSIENLLYGFYSYEAEQVRLVGNEYRDNIVYAIDPHDRSKHLLMALNTTYGTQKKHGIIISREVDESWIVGNLAFANAGSGLMLDRDSVGTLVYANSAFFNDQDGLTLFESSCNLILSNNFSENRRTGIKVRNSADVAVFDNIIARNAGAAIEGYIANLEEAKGSALRDFELDAYTPLTTLAIARNAVLGNGSGIAARGVSGIALGENTFRRQSSRLFSGDLKSIGLPVLRASREGTGAFVQSTCRSRPAAHTCPFFESGTLDRQLFAKLTDASGDESFCVKRAETVQGQAFETGGENRDGPSN